MQLLVPIMIFSCVYMCVFFRIYEFNSLEVILLLSAKDSTADIPSSSTTSARKNQHLKSACDSLFIIYERSWIISLLRKMLHKS